jgi:Fe2+ or Zn2+ uptake regulation protein
MKIWKPHPLDLTIVEVLEKKGPMTDAELYDLLKETCEGLGFSTLNQTLMRLEIEGKVYVSALSRGKRRVELEKRKETIP